MKKLTRRKFIYSSILLPSVISQSRNIEFIRNQSSGVKAAATWSFGRKATDEAFKMMTHGMNSLDAVEKAANIIEADETIHSVGLGGYPDKLGNVTLDAAIMDWKGNAGSVGFLQNILHPISVARKVMEKTDHVMLVGEGALKFALENGFEETDLLTEDAKEYWKKKKRLYELKENHDTLGLIAIDANGNMSVGVTTSGTFLKIHGRVGDSPIIGAGLYMDNEVGGAVATGRGEISMKTVGSFLIVEKMREGYSPQEACKIATERGIPYSISAHSSICYLAMNKNGEVGAFSTYPKFKYAVTDKNGSGVFNSEYIK